MTPRCIVIGPPGAGKTTVGRILSEVWQCDFLDTDELVVERSGRSVSEIFIEDGEERFRSLEAQALRAALASDAVVALGGGAVVDPANQQAIRDAGAPVAYLAVGIASAAPRIGFNRDRPLLLGNPRAQWMALLEARLPIYTSLADFTVDTNDRNPADVADEIATLVGGA